MVWGGVVQVRMFKDLIRQKEHMVLPDLAQDLAQVHCMPLLLPHWAAKSS